MNLCRKLYKQTYAMIGQAKISSFFSPAQKRNVSDAGNEKSENTLLKKAKVTKKESSENSIDKSHTSPQCGSSPPGIQLSPEQKQRIDENRCQALAKLHQKKASGLLVDFGKSWYTALEPEFTKPYFKQLSEFVEKERSKATVYPTPENVFSWTRACDVSDVKVVILGQDPYHGPNQAHGLCFSVLPGVPPPPSLVNMYKELVDDIEGFERPKHGYLQGWAKQGVLLLNAVLTVRSHQANSHKDKGWEKFTDATISYLNKNKEGIVFMLWGGYAQKKGAHIDKTRHHILKSVHPSPLSAHRGFLGCKHFSKCNELLKSDGKAPIDWTDLTET